MPGDVAMYLMLASPGIAILGLAGLVVDPQPLANVLLTLGILGWTAAMGLVLIVGSHSNTPVAVTDDDADHPH